MAARQGARTSQLQPGITLNKPGSRVATHLAHAPFVRCGRITTAGVVTEYPVPSGNVPWQITAGPDGALWFSETYSNNIGRMTTAGAVTEYPIPTSDSWPQFITAGPDGELWFTEGTGNSIGQAVFVTASLSVSPASGAYQTNLTFTGSTFAPDESVQIYVGGVGSAVLASATADSSGSFTVTAHAPQSAYGPRLFLGVGQTSGKLGAASFSVKPRLILNPTSGAVGSTVTAQGYGFGALEQVKVYWQDPSTLLATAIANVHGTFSGGGAITFTVPTGAPTGANKVTGKGQTTNAVGGATFTVQ